MFEPMFVPPRYHAGLVWFANTFVPHLGRLFGNVHGLTVDPESLDRVRALKGRAILCPNHPTETDPIVVYWLAREAGRQFNYLTTRESLEGPRGYLLNRIGAYSVIRGYPDRESIRMTRKLLAELDRQVVIFPEGLVYEHNDKLLDFQSGVVQMGFWALDDVVKAGRDPELPVLPVAIRYRCRSAPEPWIERGLAALERELKLGEAAKASAVDRVVRIAGRVLEALERAEGLKPAPEGELEPRIAAVRRSILERVAEAVGAEVPQNQSPGEQLHHLTNELRAWVGVLPDEHTEYEERLHRQRAEVAGPLFAELMRLHNFVAISGDYLAVRPTAERLLEVLGRLEKEVMGRIRHAAPLRAIVRVAPAIRLEERREEYREDKRAVVSRVTEELESTVRGMLDGLAHESTPLQL